MTNISALYAYQFGGYSKRAIKNDSLSFSIICDRSAVSLLESGEQRCIKASIIIPQHASSNHRNTSSVQSNNYNYPLEASTVYLWMTINRFIYWTEKEWSDLLALKNPLGLFLFMHVKRTRKLTTTTTTTEDLQWEHLPRFQSCWPRWCRQYCPGSRTLCRISDTKYTQWDRFLCRTSGKAYS